MNGVKQMNRHHVGWSVIADNVYGLSLWLRYVSFCRARVNGFMLKKINGNCLEHLLVCCYF